MKSKTRTPKRKLPGLKGFSHEEHQVIFWKGVVSELNAITAPNSFIVRNGKIQYGYFCPHLLIHIVDTRRQSLDQYLYWNQIIAISINRKLELRFCFKKIRSNLKEDLMRYHYDLSKIDKCIKSGNDIEDYLA